MRKIRKILEKSVKVRKRHPSCGTAEIGATPVGVADRRGALIRIGKLKIEGLYAMVWLGWRHPRHSYNRSQRNSSRQPTFLP